MRCQQSLKVKGLLRNKIKIIDKKEKAKYLNSLKIEKNHQELKKKKCLKKKI